MTEEIKQLLRQLFDRLNSSNTTDSVSRDSSRMEAVKQILDILLSAYTDKVFELKMFMDAEDTEVVNEIVSFLTNSSNVKIKNQLAEHTLDLGIEVDNETKEIFWELADDYFAENRELLMSGFNSSMLEKVEQIRAIREEEVVNFLDTADLFVSYYGNMSHILDDADLESFDEYMARMAKAMENILDPANIASCRDDIANIKKYFKDNKGNFSKEMLPKLQEMRNKFAEDWELVVKDLEKRNPTECLGLQEIVKHVLNKLDAKCLAIFVAMVDEVLEVLVPDYKQGLRNIEIYTNDSFSPETLASFFDYMKKPSMLETKEKLVKHELNLASTEEQGAQVNRIWDSYGFNVGKDIDRRKENFWHLADMVFKQNPMLLMEVDKKKLDANYETAARLCQHKIDMADIFLKNNKQNTSSALLKELETLHILFVRWERVAHDLELHSDNPGLCGRVELAQRLLKEKYDALIQKTESEIPVPNQSLAIKGAINRNRQSTIFGESVKERLSTLPVVPSSRRVTNKN